MSGTGATTVRVLRQLRHDPRTVVLLLVVPAALMTIFRFVYDRQRFAFALAGPPLMVIFPLFTMFLVSSIAVLRERTSGTLERLMTTPLGRLPLLAGYGVAFTLLAIVQACVISAISLGPLGLTLAGSTAFVVVLAAAVALLGLGLGLLASAFARTEFQVVQFFPVMIVPQLLLCGLLVPRSHMSPVAARHFRRAADVLRRRRHPPPRPGIRRSCRRGWRSGGRRRVRGRRDRARRAHAPAGHGLMPGRRAGPTRTRESILDAARAAFAARGYDATSIRLVARSAGVDPALVLHFFTNKPGLFAAASQLPVDPEAFVTALLAGPRATLGRRLVEAVVELWDGPGYLSRFWR